MSDATTTTAATFMCALINGSEDIEFVGAFGERQEERKEKKATSLSTCAHEGAFLEEEVTAIN